MKAAATKPALIVNKWELPAFAYVYSLLAILAAVYVVITYRAADIIGRYNLSADSTRYFEAHVIRIAVDVALWVVIARAAVRFKFYAKSLSRTEDGEALNYIANALILALLYAISFTMSSTIKTLFYRSSNFKTATTLSNLIPIAFVLVLSGALLIGSLKLNRISSIKMVKKKTMEYFIALILFLAAVLLYGMYFYRVAPTITDDDGLPHFVLTPTKLMLVYVLPYGIAWLLSLIGSLNLAYYAHHVEGRIYRLLFSDLYAGIMLGFTGTYLIQIFTVSDLKTNGFNLGLVISLCLLGLIIWGSMLIYRGTTELYKLEQ